MGIENNIKTSTLISEVDQDKLLSALTQVRNSMQDDLILKSIKDIQRANAQAKVNEFAQLVKKLNRTLDRKTKRLLIETQQLKDDIEPTHDIESNYSSSDPNISNQFLFN